MEIVDSLFWINQKGFYVQQNKFGDKEDYLGYKDLRIISLAKKSGES